MHVRSAFSVFESFALNGLRIVLAVGLERVGVLFLLLVFGVARRRAQLLHLVPRRHALAARRVAGARLLRVLYALLHLLRNALWSCANGSDPHHPTQPDTTKSHPLAEWNCELYGVRVLRWGWCVEENPGAWKAHTSHSCHSLILVLWRGFMMMRSKE